MFGGDPISVPIPPSEAEAGIPSNKAFEKGASLPSLSISGKMEAIIIAVIAVFDMIIDASAVASIIPSNRFLGFVPKTFTV